jgi:hypothetical protein
VGAYCADLFIQLATVREKAEIYVSKDPVQYPTQHQLSWTANTSVEPQQLWIPSSDPDFEVGVYFIGVFAQCQSMNIDGTPNYAEYNLTAQMLPGK